MPRPRKCRFIAGKPDARFFKPQGVPLRQLEEIYLPLEGVEALRLAELEGMNQDEAAQLMGVSRQTFGRVLAQARRSLAQAVVEGLALRIAGGDYAVRDDEPADPINNEGKPPRIEDRIPETKPGGESSPTSSKELKMSKVAITSEGPTLEDRVDPRFGRAAGFIVVDTETMAHEYIDNGSSQAMSHGAGIQAAENVVQSGAAVVLTGYVGPKAFDALNAVGIKIGQNLEGMTVAQAVEKYKAGEVPLANSPNTQAGGRR